LVNVVGDGNCMFRALSVGHTKKVIDDNGKLQENNYYELQDLIKEEFDQNYDSKYK